MSSGKSCHQWNCQNLKLEIGKGIADEFYSSWNFPNCLGALDGKHMVMQAPPKSGNQFFNYKGTFSIVLMALVDDDYRFTYVEIGDYGSNSGGALFKNCVFGKVFMNDELDVPPPTHLPNYPASGPVSYCFVADEAFPLCCDLMRPFVRLSASLEQALKVFNYRFSRARCIVENAFGILAQRWRVFHRKLNLLPENADKIVKDMHCTTQLPQRKEGSAWLASTTEPRQRAILSR